MAEEKKPAAKKPAAAKPAAAKKPAAERSLLPRLPLSLLLRRSQLLQKLLLKSQQLKLPS
jgi:hypothetical protein